MPTMHPRCNQILRKVIWQISKMPWPKSLIEKQSNLLVVDNFSDMLALSEHREYFFVLKRINVVDKTRI